MALKSKRRRPSPRAMTTMSVPAQEGNLFPPESGGARGGLNSLRQCASSAPL
ncbi:MAG: hypothetical protein IKH35_00985 [Prevotella sp.]|nr:hypothetical protein [Prevotella sp.]